MSSNDERFVVPLYSATDAARHLDVPASTFRTWARGYRNLPEGRSPVVGDQSGFDERRRATGAVHVRAGQRGQFGGP